MDLIKFNNLSYLIYGLNEITVHFEEVSSINADGLKYLCIFIMFLKYRWNNIIAYFEKVSISDMDKARLLNVFTKFLV